MSRTDPDAILASKDEGVAYLSFAVHPVPVAIRQTEGYGMSLRRRKMIEEGFAWVKDIGTLRRLMARGLETVRAHVLLNFSAYNLTRLGNLMAL